MGGGPTAILAGAQPHFAGESVGHDHADADGLAMQQAAVIATHRLERMGKGMPEIQQGPLASFMLVRLDNPRLGLRRMVRMACASAASSRCRTSVPFASSHSKKPASPRSPYFTTSA